MEKYAYGANRRMHTHTDGRARGEGRKEGKGLRKASGLLRCCSLNTYLALSSLELEGGGTTESPPLSSSVRPQAPPDGRMSAR